MWYVIQTYTGREDAAKTLIEQIVPSGSYEEVFTPRYRAMRKVDGQWESYLADLVPGYLIVDTKRVREFEAHLRAVPSMTRMLGDDVGFVPLDQDERSWLEAWTKRDARVIEPSRARIEQGRVKIVSGPLLGQEGKIVKVNRRKRTATLRMRVMGRPKDVTVALEIMGKGPDLASGADAREKQLGGGA